MRRSGAARARVPRIRRPRGAALKIHAHVLLDRLLAAYPGAHCALDFGNAFELLCATILSAQCTDKRVNIVTPALFARYPDAASLSAADPEEVEDLVRSTGFFRSKTKSLIGMATGLVERHGGDVPAEMDSLTALPGVGRKTANVILGNAFGRNDGIVVDTIARIHAHAVHAQAPNWFTTAPVGAIEKVLKRSGWNAKDVDLWEVNEAFAAVTLAAMAEFKLAHEIVNVNGGATALGHPIGASGARILATLIAALQNRGLKRGVASLCIGGGEATAMAVELV